MPSNRVTVGAGLACLIVAIAGLLAGGADGVPWLSIVFVPLAALLLLVGLVRVRGGEADARDHDPERADRTARRAFVALCGLAAIAAVVAIAVAEGEAQGHATAHMMSSLVGLGLFAALAFLWHPRPGTGPATFRGTLLVLLAVATVGTLIESLGGAGYDSANSGRRIPWLASLHDVGLLFGPALLLAIPVAAVTSAVVLVMWAIRKLPATS